MRFSKKAKKQNGSALAVLMVFLTAMMVFGVGMLSVSNNHAMQAKASVKTDKQYYAAEAAAQLGAQMLMNELTKQDLYAVADASESMPNVRDFSLDTQERLEKIAEFLRREIDSETRFNGEPTKLESIEIKNIDLDSLYGPEDLEDLEKYIGWDEANKMLYFKNPTFLINVASGNRNLVAEVSMSTDAEDAITGSDGGGGSLKHVGGLQSDKSEGIYSGGDKELYDYYLAELEKLLDKSDADYNYIRGNENRIITDSAFYTESTYEAYNWDKALNAKYLNVHGVVTLGKAGQTTVYQNLEYIKTGNSLKILGTVYCPKLKGVSVVGVNIGESGKAGILYCPSLETLYSKGGNMTVWQGSAINPMEVDAAGNVINQNKPTTSGGSCNFYGDTVLTVKCSAEINWCRFNFSNIAVEYGNKGKLTSNSIFTPRGWVELSGTVSSDTSRVIPQFYARGYIKFSGSNPGNVTGIFMSPSNDAMFNNGNDISDDVNFTGLFVGNCDVGQSLHPPLYWGRVPIGQYYDNGQPRDDFEVYDFDDDTYELLMDGDWITDGNSGGGSGSTDGQDATISLGDNKSITIREVKK